MKAERLPPAPRYSHRRSDSPLSLNPASRERTERWSILDLEIVRGGGPTIVATLHPLANEVEHIVLAIEAETERLLG